MQKKSTVQEGWDFTAHVMGVNSSTLAAGVYVQNVDDAVQQLVKDINSHEGTKLGVDKLKGFVAEYWHADTFNIDAALKGSVHKAIIEGSNEHASVDVSTNFGNNYSMKYYATGKDSAVNQAKNVIQAYHEYLSKSKAENPLSFEQYIEKYGYSDDMTDLLMSVYRGQGRIIPSDQLEDAIKYLERKIATESAKDGANRAVLLESYKETLEKLSDRIKDDAGVESKPLTKEEAEAIAALCKDGEFKAEDFGFGLDEIITTEYILNQALKAGYTAAVITVVMQLAPEIIKAIDYLIKNGELDVNQIKKTGVKAVSAGAEGFLRGSISSALTIACKSGKLGASMMKVSPQVIGMLTVLTLDTVKNSILVATGKMEPRVMGSVMTKEVIISASALAGGTIGQAIAPELPVIGYMLGSLIGSVFATVTLSVGEKCLLSFCVDTGFTCFGLVKQDYTLPESVLEEMGIAIAQVERAYPNVAEVDRATVDTVEVDRAKYDTVEFMILRRGIIGVNKIGYVL